MHVHEETCKGISNRRSSNTGLLRQVVGDQFGMGIDDTHMKIRGAPVLDEPALSPHQKMIADKLAVSELMSMAVVALPPIVKVRCPPRTSRADEECCDTFESLPEQAARCQGALPGRDQQGDS